MVEPFGCFSEETLTMFCVDYVNVLCSVVIFYAYVCLRFLLKHVNKNYIGRNSKWHSMCCDIRGYSGLSVS